MESKSTQTLTWANGRWQEAERLGHDPKLAALCQAIEQAVRPHQADAGLRTVVLTVEPVLPVAIAAPIHVDVYDSGYGHGI
jgi:hypothetical protein